MHNQGCCSRCMFECIVRTLLEAAFDLMGWPKWVQSADRACITTIFWTQEVPTWRALGPNKARVDQSDLRVSSVFHKEYLGLQDLDRKSTKNWLKWHSTSWECKEVAWSDSRPHESGSKGSNMQNVRGLLLFIEHRRGHHGAAQVANVPTWIAQGAKLDHMGSDFRCKNEVRTTRNC